MSTYHQLNYKSQPRLRLDGPTSPELQRMEARLSFPVGAREDMRISGSELDEVFLNWE